MGKVHTPTEVGFEAAAAAGLDAQSIGTMSKHQIERGSSKMNNSYYTELFPPVLLWASGCDKDNIHLGNIHTTIHVHD
jgi:hypothetical protein